MKPKRNRRLIQVLSLCLLVVFTLTACQGSPAQTPAAADTQQTATGAPAASTEPADNKEPTPLSILSPEDGRVVKEDNPVWLELEKRTNTQLTLMLLPGSDIPSKLNTMAASQTLPDIIKYKDFFPYAQQGAMMELDDLIDQYGQNLKAHLPEHLWEFTKYEGKQVAIPYLNEAGKFVLAVRADWLDKLGLSMPTTLEEYRQVAVAFANEDPDGNGERDSYAIAFNDDLMPIYGAFGITEGRQYYIEDNKSYVTNVSPAYKEVLTFLNGLWNDKVIDPDFLIMQSDQYRQKVAQGKIGMVSAWWSIIPQVVIGQLGFSELNPDGNWEVIPTMPKGPGGPLGDNGVRSAGEYQQATWIAANSKYPAEAIQFLDYLITDEGYDLSYYGIQGVHYNTREEGRLPEGQAGFEEKWLDSFNQIVGRRNDIVAAQRDPENNLADYYAQVALEYNLYEDAFYGLPVTDADLSYGADLSGFEKESRIAFMTGERSLDEYDQYVQEWLDLGGREILAEQTAQYNELRGANIEPGLQ